MVTGNTMSQHLRARRAFRTWTIAALLAPCLVLRAAPVDPGKLPPPATHKIDYLRDIKPILDGACLKCHGPEKPKSRFRLDEREALLKGGENGVDVLPGDSAKSPFIHFVARLVPDMEMPPAGKGEPLTTSQISLLRAWIDQDVPWDGSGPKSREQYEVITTAGWTGVSGNRDQFREHAWQPEGWNGGLDKYLFTDQLGPDTRFTLEGRALRDDYKVSLSVERNDLGFVRGGWEQYRRYYGDSGGYYSLFSPSISSLDSDLHLDIGKAWAEVGLTLPSWPKAVLGYEYHYQNGEKSLNFAWVGSKKCAAV